MFEDAGGKNVYMYLQIYPIYARIYKWDYYVFGSDVNCLFSSFIQFSTESCCGCKRGG